MPGVSSLSALTCSCLLSVSSWVTVMELQYHLRCYSSIISRLRNCRATGPMFRPLAEPSLYLLIGHGLRHCSFLSKQYIGLGNPRTSGASTWGWGSCRCKFLISLAGSIASPVSYDALHSLYCEAASPGVLLHSSYHLLNHQINIKKLRSRGGEILSIMSSVFPSFSSCFHVLL